MMSKLALDNQQALPRFDKQNWSTLTFAKQTSSSDCLKYFEDNNIIEKMANDYKDSSLVKTLNNFYFEKYLSKSTKLVSENESLFEAGLKKDEKIVDCSNQIQSLNNMIGEKDSLLIAAKNELQMKVDGSLQIQALKNMLVAYESTYDEYRSFDHQTPFFLNQIMCNMIADFKEELSFDSPDTSSLSVDENITTMKAEILSLKLQLSQSKQSHADEIEALKADFEDRLRTSEHQNVLLNKCIADIEQESIRSEQEIDALKNSINLFNEKIHGLEKDKAEWERKYLQLEKEHRDLFELTINGCETRLKAAQIALRENQKLNNEVDELRVEFERAHCHQVPSSKTPSAECVHLESVQLHLDTTKHESELMQNKNGNGKGELTDSNRLGNPFDYEVEILSGNQDGLLNNNGNGVKYENMSLFDEMKFVEILHECRDSAKGSDLNKNGKGEGQLTDSNRLGIGIDNDKDHKELLNLTGSQHGYGHGNPFDYEVDILNGNQDGLLDGNGDVVEYENMSLYDEMKFVELLHECRNSAKGFDLE